MTIFQSEHLSRPRRYLRSLGPYGFDPQRRGPSRHRGEGGTQSLLSRGWVLADGFIHVAGQGGHARSRDVGWAVEVPRRLGKDVVVRTSCCPGPPPIERPPTGTRLLRDARYAQGLNQMTGTRDTGPSITSGIRPHKARPLGRPWKGELRAAGGHGAPVTAERCGDGRIVAESGWAMSSSDRCSASTPRNAATTPPKIMTPAPMR